MVKLYEVELLYNYPTGYYIEAPSILCGQKYIYVANHQVTYQKKLSDLTKYIYVTSAQDYCSNISNEDGVFHCLSSCLRNHPNECSLNLQPPTTIVLKDYSYKTDFSNLNVTISPVNNLANFSQGLSNEQYTTLELSGKGVWFNNLTISGVNIIAHDISNIAILVNNRLVINRGSHSFYDNSGLGAIQAYRDISLIDASITFRNNSSVQGGAIFAYGALTIQNTGGGSLDFCGNNALSSGNGGAIAINDQNISLIDARITFRSNHSNVGGAIYGDANLTISGSKTNLKFYDNSAWFGGGAIYTGLGGSLTIQNTSGGSLDFSNNQPNDIFLTSATNTPRGNICPPLFDCSDKPDNKLCNQLIPQQCTVQNTSWDISIGANCIGKGVYNTCCSYNSENPTCASGFTTDCTNQGVNILGDYPPPNRLANFKKAWQTCISDNSCNGIQEVPLLPSHKAWFLMYDLSLSECSSNIFNNIVYKINKKNK